MTPAQFLSRLLPIWRASIVPAVVSADAFDGFLARNQDQVLELLRPVVDEINKAQAIKLRKNSTSTELAKIDQLPHVAHMDDEIIGVGWNRTEAFKDAKRRKPSVPWFQITVSPASPSIVETAPIGSKDWHTNDVGVVVAGVYKRPPHSSRPVQPYFSMEEDEEEAEIAADQAAYYAAKARRGADL